jgi:hypothetical protein
MDQIKRIGPVMPLENFPQEIKSRFDFAHWIQRHAARRLHSFVRWKQTFAAAIHDFAVKNPIK